MALHYRAVSVFLAGFLLAAGGFAQSKKRGADDADQKELYNYVMTMDKLQKLDAATKGLEELARKHPEIKGDRNANSLDEMVQKFQKYPEAVAMLNKNGLTPREYAVGVMTLMQAAMAVGFKKSGTYKEYPPEMLKLVSKANLDFVEQHWAAIEKLTKGQDQ